MYVCVFGSLTVEGETIGWSLRLAYGKGTLGCTVLSVGFSFLQAYSMPLGSMIHKLMFLFY